MRHSARRILLLSTVLMFSCVGTQENKGQDLYNFNKIGFLNKNNAQVECIVSHKLIYINQADKKWRHNLINQCKDRLVLFYGNYRAHYEMDQKAKLKGEKPVPLGSKKIDWTNFQKAELAKVFRDFTSGQVVYEENIRDAEKRLSTRFLYRVQYENLVFKVQKTPFPFSIY